MMLKPREKREIEPDVTHKHGQLIREKISRDRDQEAFLGSIVDERNYASKRRKVAKMLSKGYTGPASSREKALALLEHGLRDKSILEDRNIRNKYK